MKVLDIAPHRGRRQEFSYAITNSGHEVITVPGRREAIAAIKQQEFDLAVLDGESELYDTREFVAELCAAGNKQEPIIAVVMEPKNRPPRHRIAGRAENVVFLQDGSVDHMARMVHLAFTIRDHDGETLDAVEVPLEEEAKA